MNHALPEPLVGPCAHFFLQLRATKLGTKQREIDMRGKEVVECAPVVFRL